MISSEQGPRGGRHIDEDRRTAGGGQIGRRGRGADGQVKRSTEGRNPFEIILQIKARWYCNLYAHLFGNGAKIVFGPAILQADELNAGRRQDRLPSAERREIAGAVEVNQQAFPQDSDLTPPTQ